MNRVTLAWGEPVYPEEPPFGPGGAYPEARFAPGPPNPAYDLVRESLARTGLDAGRLGTPAWNPLGDLIRPGETIVVKPNFVRDFHDHRREGVEAVITHGAVLRAVLDYAQIALKGSGRLIVTDVPQHDASFERLIELAGLDRIKVLYDRPGFVRLEVFDLRTERVDSRDGVVARRVQLLGDPLGYSVVDLGPDSILAELDRQKPVYRGSDYDLEETVRHQSRGVHEYLIPNTILGADVVINVPKLKTHKKAGITVALKNMIGISGNKNWLPHYREGVPAQGGDQYDRSGLAERVEGDSLRALKKWLPKAGPVGAWTFSALKAIGRAVFGSTEETVRSGNWYGNDTIWRTILDLNRILLYAGRDGVMCPSRVRRYLAVVDGIVAGEGNGPLAPRAKPCGLVVVGDDPMVVDLACARVMGFDWRKIPQLSRAGSIAAYPLGAGSPEEIEVASNRAEWNGRMDGLTARGLSFEPHFGWRGHIESRG